MKGNMLMGALALLLVGVVVIGLMHLQDREQTVEGLEGQKRTLVRVWLVNAPGGAERWLKGQISDFEKQHRGMQVYLRQVQADMLLQRNPSPPDVVLYMPGDIGALPDAFMPLEGEWPLREGLLSAAQKDEGLYALPLCWGAWVLAVDFAYDAQPAATPAPTTLLGRASEAPQAKEERMPYPLEKVSEETCPLLSPGGCALDALRATLTTLPPLSQEFAQLPQAEVYSRFRARKCASAMLTTGQVVAFSSLLSSGHGFPFRVMTPETVATEQVLYASMTEESSAGAGALLSFLLGRSAQEQLRTQGLFSARSDISLYATGWAAEIELAAQRALEVPEIDLPQAQAQQAAWRRFGMQ